MARWSIGSCSGRMAKSKAPPCGRSSDASRADHRPLTPLRCIPPLLWVRDDGHNCIQVSLNREIESPIAVDAGLPEIGDPLVFLDAQGRVTSISRSEEHTSELQSLRHLVCR